VRQSARGSLILILGRVLSGIVSALGSIFVARFLGSKSYGQITVVLIPISFASLFLDFGISSALIRYIAQYRYEKKPDELKTIMQTGLLFKIALGAFLSLLLFFFSGFLADKVFHQPELKLLIEIASATLFASSLISSSKSIFIGFDHTEFYSLTIVIQSFLRSLLAPILVFLGYGIFGAVLGRTAPIIITGIIGITIVGVTFLKEISSYRRTLSHLQALKILLSYGVPLFLSGFLASGLYQLSMFLVVIYVDSSLIGNYKAAMNFSMVLNFWSLPIAQGLFPLFSKIGDGEKSTLHLVFQNSVKYYALIIAPMIAALMAFSGQLIRIFYGSGYQFAPLYLKFSFISSLLFAGLGNLSLNNLLKGQGKTDILFRSGLLNFCFRLPLVLILIPRFGIFGLLLSYAIPTPGYFVSLSWVRKNLGFTIKWSASAKIFLSVGIAYLASIYLLTVLHYGDWVDLLLGGGVYGLIYIILVILTGVIDRKDIQQLRNFKSVLGPFAPLFNFFLSFIERFV